MADISESPAQAYERHMVPAMFIQWVPDVLALAGVRAGQRVLDVACGTGVIARNAVKLVGASGSVTGIDLNSGMLEMARSLDGSIEWIEANAVDLRFPDGHFDVAICQQGLQFIPDRLAAVKEMYRVLVPGGRVTVIAWFSLEHSPGHLAITQALERNVSEDVATLMGTGFSLGDADELRGLLDEVGFRDISVRSDTKTAQFHSADGFVRRVVMGSAVGRAGITLSDDVFRALIQDVSQALAPYIDGSRLSFPMSANMCVATK